MMMEDTPAVHRSSRPSEAAGGHPLPQDRRHRCLQGRPSYEVSRGLRQAGRTVRCPRRLICLGHPAIQHHDLDGPVNAQRAFVLRPVRARGHLGADPRQDCSIKAKGPVGRGTLPFGYEMKDGKIAIVEEEAELVRLIFRRYLELDSVNELLRDLKERNIRTRTKLLSTGATRGGIPFGRGALYYVLSNHFYLGEVKYKNEILPGEQPPIMDRELFDAVRQKSLDQWSHRSILRNKSDQLLTGLLFDDAGHRMVPTHATKAGVRYRYYVSTPFLHGEAKTASAGSVSRIPAADIEDVIVKSLKEHHAAKQDKATIGAVRIGVRGDIAQLIAGIVVYKDRLIVQLKSDNADEASDCADDQSLSIPWQKPPSKRSREILLPHNASRSKVRPQQFERRAGLVSAIARGRRWLDDVVSGRVTTVAQLCTREKCSVRQVNMTISLAFLAPNLIKAAVEGRLPRGIGIERLRDPPTEWGRQFDALGLNPE